MWGRICVGVFVACWVVCWASGSTAAPGATPVPPSAASSAALRVLDKPAFTATPAELLAAARTAPAGDGGMVILREQRDVSFDDVGRASVRARRVYVVQSENGADPDDAEDDTIGAEWHPSYQNAPTIRARVITVAGNSVDLDPAQLTEKPLGPRAGAEGDLRYLAAALPALATGAVVEQEIVTSDREPPPAGSVDTTEIGSFAPTSSTVISYSAPAAGKFHHVERKLPAGARVRHQVAHGRETWSYEIGAVPVKEFREIDSPVDAVGSPYVGVGTAASWEAVAHAYRKLLDRRIADGPFALPAELPSTASVEAVAAITAWVHKRVRPAAALGDVVKTPVTPAETVKQAVGDRNDKATLIVALLRQAGIRADVALVEAARGKVLDPELPGMGAFDRAIVRARVGARELWIDPGEPMARPGQLPERAQGRRVLLIADDAKALTLTPAAAPADNTVRDVRTFAAPEYGLSQLTQVVHYTGVFEIDERKWSRAARADVLKKQRSHRIQSMFGGTLEQIATSDPEDLTKPFEQTVTVKDVPRVGSEREQIDVYLYPNHALEHLPWILRDKGERPRHNDFVWPVPQIHEVENRIVVPVGFDLPAAAPERVRRLGTATLTERQRLDGRTLIVTFQLDTGKVRIAPAELATLQAAVRELDEVAVHIKIDQTAFALSAAGKPREAIAECERQIALHPKEALHHDQLSTILLRVGIGEAARREARKAVAIAPGDVDALVVLGWTLGFDTLGRQYTYDWDRAGAIAALQQARKLDPGHLGAIETLAQVLERDAAGRVFESADLPAAAEAWRAALAIDKTDENALALAKVLLWSGQFAEAEKVARTASASEERNKWIVMAVAGGAGGKAAIKAADDLRIGAGRNQLLDGVGWALLVMQRYDAARELLTESGMMAKMPPVASAMLNKLKKQPALPSKPAASPSSSA
jgi:tetratricopeptide (TPR) repeat protein/transglutaminase-like putative cysteine protease